MTKIGVAKVQLGVILILVAVYFLQAATPLRLHPDTVVLLSVAETVEHGGAYLYHGQPTVFPPGYPTLLASLIRVHLAHVWVIVGINVIFLVIGLLAVRFLFRSMGFSESSVLGVCILSLLSIVFIKNSAMPLTDNVFFGVSMCCLAVMKSVSSHFSLRRVVASLGLVIASICIRRIGIALIPAFLWMLISQCEIRLCIMRLSVRMKAASIIVAASVAMAIAWVVYTTSTLRDFNPVATGNSVDLVLGILAVHLKELGEIALNLSLPLVVGKSLPLVGLLVLSLVFLGVAWRERLGVTEVYVASYVAVILACRSMTQDFGCR